MSRNLTAGPASTRFDLYCPGSRSSVSILLVGAPGRARESLAGLATYLASNKFAVAVVDGVPPGENGSYSLTDRFDALWVSDARSCGAREAMVVVTVGGRAAEFFQARLNVDVGVRIDPDGGDLTPGAKWLTIRQLEDRGTMGAFGEIVLDGTEQCDLTSDQPCTTRGGLDQRSLVRRYLTSFILARAEHVAWAAQWLPPQSNTGVHEATIVPERVKHVMQFNLSMTAGVSARTESGNVTAHGSVGARPEITFLRGDSRDLGVGPYIEVLTTGEGDLVFGGGMSLVIPTFHRSSGFFSETAFVPSIGGYTRSHDGSNLGVTAGAFFGWRAYNDLTSFDGSFGLRLDARYGFGQVHDRAVLLSWQVDLTLVAAIFGL